jgi:hypothetical protein
VNANDGILTSLSTGLSSIVNTIFG